MKISVVCGTRATDKETFLKFLQSLDGQTIFDFDVNVVCDREFNQKTESEFLSFFHNQNLNILHRVNFYTNINSEFNPKHTGGASYVRNFGLQKAQGEFVQLLDDDDIVGATFLADCLEKWENKTRITKSDCIIFPTLYFRDTEKIQNQGFSHFNYMQSRPVLYLLKPHQKESEVQMFSGNGIFGLANTLKSIKYDEKIARISEDLDYTLSLREKGVHLRVFSDLGVMHFERKKTKLEQARIGSYSQARQKSRNWFLFTKKHGNQRNKIQFYMCGLPGCLMRLSTKAIIFGGKDRRNIIKGLFSGAKEGWKLTHKKSD